MLKLSDIETRRRTTEPGMQVVESRIAGVAQTFLSTPMGSDEEVAWATERNHREIAHMLYGEVLDDTGRLYCLLSNLRFTLASMPPVARADAEQHLNDARMVLDTMLHRLGAVTGRQFDSDSTTWREVEAESPGVDNPAKSSDTA